ncbi:hypothetical protein A7K99_17965 [Tatumella citrea]|uniref:Uncharacterized protein n=1 Tax=Tatumella citrea TaxID=53336 RepID=A0A1Y0LPQ1_TATCI|nr:hypothetical protein A7K98_17980 [Tatumella citrea]ARU99508.1 hypothetical protein A7K99_17965 [Tatumella citrea]
MNTATLIALDIAKKHLDTKIRHLDGQIYYLRIENTRKDSTDYLHLQLHLMAVLSLPLNQQLIIIVILHGGYISKEFSAILFLLSDERELVICCSRLGIRITRKSFLKSYRG